MTMQHSAAIEPYTLLRVSLALFKKPPAELSSAELRRAERQAFNEYDLEARVLRSPEAAAVIINPKEVEAAFAEIRGRYDSEEAFQLALQNNGLGMEALKSALARQCKVDAVLERVASRSPKANDVEVRIFYHLHPDKFRLPESRLARHILISVNADYPENTREQARQRIEDIAKIVQCKPYKFPDMALKHSECPTALNGGQLGTVGRGKLYAELEEALFALKENEISPVVETEIGFHLVQCLKIFRAHTLSLKKATPKIRELIQERYRRNCQRTWLASLPAVKP